MTANARVGEVGERSIERLANAAAIFLDEGRRDRAAACLRDYADLVDPDGDVRSAVRGIADDYMTSEQHHPGWVLIPQERFDRLRKADGWNGQQSGPLTTNDPGLGNDWFGDQDRLRASRDAGTEPHP